MIGPDQHTASGFDMPSQSRFVVGRMRAEDAAAFDNPPRTAYIYFGQREGLKLGAGVCEVPVGSSNQRHAHDDADEVIYVLRGTVRFEFPGESLTLGPTEAVYIPAGLDHQIFNAGEVPALHTFTFSPAGPEEAIRRKYRGRP